MILTIEIDSKGAKLRTKTAQESDFNCGLLSKKERKGFAGAMNPISKGRTKEERELW